MAQAHIALAIAASLSIAACSAPSGQRAPYNTCFQTYASFAGAVDRGNAARREGRGADALYEAQLAHMNLDVLLARDCCRFDDTCPAVIEP